MRRTALLLLIAIAIGGCAKSSTVVMTTVDVAPDVAPILLLRMTVTMSSDPGRTVSSAIRSLSLGDAVDRPAPFLFPLGLPVSVDPSFAGAVTITIEGLDWDTHGVIASGSAPAEVVPEQRTQTSVTLAAVGTGPDADGGASD